MQGYHKSIYHYHNTPPKGVMTMNPDPGFYVYKVVIKHKRWCKYKWIIEENGNHKGYHMKGLHRNYQMTDPEGERLRDNTCTSGIMGNRFIVHW